MSRTRESLFAAALALCSPWAVADSITVNTTTDDFQANSLCSLREAVEYFNRGKPEGGFQGCVAPASDTSDGITVPQHAQPYVITGSAITIRTALQISGGGRSGDEVTRLRVTGAHRAFVVNYNPQYLAPRCAPDCASQPSSFNISSSSDTDTAGDYLTSNNRPEISGTLPAETDPVLPPHSYIIRVYDNPKEGERVSIGQLRVPLSTSATPWKIVPGDALSSGVHHLTYTVEEVNNNSGDTVAEEALGTGTLQVAVHPALNTVLVRLEKMIIEGGCAASTTCATDVDDNLTRVNDPAASNTSYDEFALSYTNGFISTVGNGGVIYSGEGLVLSDVLVRYGGAVRGGAIYVNQQGGLSLDKVEMQLNRADRGAALYFEYSSATLQRSLFTQNVVTTPAGVGAVVEVAAATIVEPFDGTLVVNTTFSGNDGRALSLRAGAMVNASTIVLNKGGIDFNLADVQVFNTILVGNSVNPDCENLPTGPTFSNNLVLVSGLCPAVGSQSISNLDGTPEQLMATESDGRCSGTYGLLCPLADHGGATFVHMPRLLPDYDLSPAGAALSPIINKGVVISGTTTTGTCPSQDQRDKSRQQCDIGAVEFQAVTDTVTWSGGVTTYGVPYTQFLGKELEDEEVLPAGKCPAAISLQSPAAPPYYPPPELAPDPTVVVPDSYNPAVPGCPWVEVAPSRGRVVFSADGNYTYSADYQFHGSDRFYYRVVTTLSHLNVLPNDRSRLVRALVIVEPSSSMTSEKLGGAVGIWNLMVLAALGLLLRRGGRA